MYHLMLSSNVIILCYHLMFSCYHLMISSHVIISCIIPCHLALSTRVIIPCFHLVLSSQCYHLVLSSQCYHLVLSSHVIILCYHPNVIISCYHPNVIILLSFKMIIYYSWKLELLGVNTSYLSFAKNYQFLSLNFRIKNNTVKVLL
jgi:hypothetical protein